MQEKIFFYVNDRVWYMCGISKQKVYGTIEKIYSDINRMTIKLDGYDNKISVVVKKRGKDWFAFRPSHDYEEKVFKSSLPIIP